MEDFCYSLETTRTSKRVRKRKVALADLEKKKLTFWQQGRRCRS